MAARSPVWVSRCPLTVCRSSLATKAYPVTIVDLGGSLAVASKGLFATGVSTDLNVTYINSGGKIGDTIRAEANCDKFGKMLAYTSITFYNGKDQLVARGSHTK